MKKNKNILMLLSIGLILCIIPLIFGKLFGSNIDWINQHVEFADYFRNLFYKTGDILPSFAWNIGLGQNIYNFSYYGLLSPIILISYLLPFIPMYNYIMISSVFLYLLSIYLFYKWINLKYNDKITLILTIIFMFSGPLFFHFHRQLMFVNYMPFLLLCLIEIDKDRKYSLILMTLFITLMIFTSYYFSIGGILCIVIYYFYVNWEKKKSKKLMIFIPIIISILLSGILLLPTLDTILKGRSDIKSSIDFYKLIIPDLSLGNTIYGSYNLGLTAIIIPSLLALLLNKENKEKFLGMFLLVLIIFPLFRYILNGGLYIRGKVLIPFLPLYIYIIGLFINNIFNKSLDYKIVIKYVLIIAGLSLLTGYFNTLFYLDIILTIIIILLISHKKRFLGLTLLIIEMFTMFIIYNVDEDYVSKDNYTYVNGYQDLVDNVLVEDNNVYRFSNTFSIINNINSISNANYYSSSIYSSTYNYNYYKFYHDVLNTNNVTYNHLMLASSNDIITNRLLGIKYVVTSEQLGFGYDLISTKDNLYLYKNNYVMPLGYATNRIYNSDTFNTLSYPYNLESLLSGIIVDTGGDSFVPIYTTVFDDEFYINLGDNISVSNYDDYDLIHVTKDSTIKVDLKNAIVDKLLFVEIKGLEENNCDDEISIQINGVKNSLTCKEWGYPNKNNTFHFLITDDIISSLDVKISKGIYKIDELNIYTMEKEIFNETFSLMNNIQIIKNRLFGNITVSNDGYMALSIPYDDNFVVKIDDDIVDYEMVNGGFIGFKINSGYHKVELVYNNDCKKVGILISTVGLIVFCIFLMINYFSDIQVKLIDNSN